MANTLGVYDPIFYANLALEQLEMQLGITSRIHLGYEKERSVKTKGQVISIRRPANFTVQNAPIAAASVRDFETESVNITLDQYKEVKFAVTDQEFAYTGEQLISEHIAPQMRAMADYIDNDVHDLVTTGFGTQYVQATETPGSIVVADLLGARKLLGENGVPLDDGNLFCGLDHASEATLLGLSQFSQFQGAGLEGVSTQKRGLLGTKYGMEFFVASQAGGRTYTAGDLGRAAGDSLLAVDLAAGYLPGAKSILCDAGTGVEDVHPGDMVTFAGHPNHYTIASQAPVATNHITLVLKEGLVKEVVDDEVVTVFGSESTATDPLPIFHRNALGIATAPLPSNLPNQLGAKVATVMSKDGIALRSRLYYDGHASAVYVSIDILYGLAVLNSMYGCKLLR